MVSEKRQGYGATIRRGFQVAKSDIFVVLDGDGQYPAEKIEEIVDYLIKNGLDFISCSRFPLQDKKSLPFVRCLGNKLFNIATNILFGLKIRDSQSGMWVFKKSVLNKIKLESDDMPLSEEIKIRVSKNKELRFEEYPIPYYERIGESKLFPLKHGIINLLYLLKLRCELWRRNFNLKDSMFYCGLFFVLLLYLLLALRNINAPFIHVQADVNGQNGMAAINWLNYGPLNMKFGVVDKFLPSLDLLGPMAYTHHPQFFILPTFLSYKLFGISELTTRLGPLSCYLVGLLFFIFALRKLLKSDRTALISGLVFALLPGMIFFGKAFELAVFSLPNAMITFSFFIFYFTSKKNIYLYLFCLSIIFGCLMGWFYVFMPFSIWFFVLIGKRFLDTKMRKKLFLIIPIFTISAFALDFAHFALLKNSAGGVFNDLKNAFAFRSSTVPFAGWFARISQMAKLHFTWFFLLISGVGLVVAIIKYKIGKDLRVFYLLPLLLFPFLIFSVFKQWSTHPFGVIYLSLPITVFAGFLFSYLIDKSKVFGITILICSLFIGFYLSWQNQNYFYEKFVILTKEDIYLVEAIRQNLKDGELCVGANEWGLGFRGIVDWYTQKQTMEADCLSHADVKKILVFNPGFGNYFKEKALEYQNGGFRLSRCTGGYWCLMIKE